MTTDNLGATLLDDTCLEDFFTMQSQFLDDFEFGLEANNIDTLLELFEEEEHRHKEIPKDVKVTNDGKNVVKNTIECKDDNRSQTFVSMPKVSKSKTNPSEVSTKRKGTSLLAKPKKSPAKRSVINISDTDLSSFSSDLLKDHDYCLMNGDNKLYNKLPDYLTELSNISKTITNSNIYSNNEIYDKIPNYIKGYMNLTETIGNRQELTDNDDILIEFNEAYIEVSDVVFDNDLYSVDKNDSEDEDVNSNSSNSDEESKDNFKAILSDESSAQCQEKQHLVDSSYSDSNDKSSGRRSRSRSRSHEQRSYRNRRRRRLSARSSVGSISDSSSSCSSCSECGSYSSNNSDETKVNYNLSNSIIRKDTKGQQMSRKRSLKESFCQKAFSSKIKANFENSFNESVINVKSNRSSVSLNNKQDIEERKIIYVGKIPDGTTKTDIRCWFGRFGAIKEVSIHFRDRGDNYAFVTFLRRADAFEAIEHANDDTRHPKFDLSFGGRRQFCKTRYEDLDFAEEERPFGYDRMDFDSLLRSTQAKLTR